MTLEEKKLEAKKLLNGQKEFLASAAAGQNKALDRMNNLQKGFKHSTKKLTPEQRSGFMRLSIPLYEAEEEMDNLEAKLEVAEMELMCKKPKDEEEQWDIWLKFARLELAFRHQIEVYDMLLDYSNPKLLAVLNGEIPR